MVPESSMNLGKEPTFGKMKAWKAASEAEPEPVQMPIFDSVRDS
jgi:hypothetical protein